ncbi:hypothetical protein SNE40_012990 [Patella caerulea]|uniref:Endonuclease/exonuclease/phosphatase domain-containing protein n=1 Tax=Patella caerulea TaxID=87958 RepID=A0AAN8JK15_PATCE
MLNSIIQWNCRGLKPNFNEVQLLIQKHNPLAICLQETFLRNSDTLSFRHFVGYHHHSVGDGRAHGGVSIILNGDIPQSQITLNTPLQAVAVRVTLHIPITLCSVYLPPSLHLNPRDLDDLIAQLPVIICVY